MLGLPSKLPIYITATALGKLGHPEGEVVLTKAAGTRGIIQMIPTLASCSLDELSTARIPGQNQWFQLYVNSDRSITKNIIKAAEAKGAKALFITVDAPQLGRREKDMRVKFVDDAPDVQADDHIDRSQGAARAISSFIDPSLSWTDIPWFQQQTKLPIVLKGIQCGDDAVLAAQAGVQGIVVSNHGGRQLDTSRSGIEILQEVMDALREKGLENKLEVYVDGGFRRGTDVFKALALGAKGVGIGRPFLYAMSAYGQPGVERAIDLLEDELIVAMRLTGCPSLSAIKREMVMTSSLNTHAGTALEDSLVNQTYQRLQLPAVSKL
jgi:L-lactate dehydrogenase (cytochrome)